MIVKIRVLSICLVATCLIISGRSLSQTSDSLKSVVILAPHYGAGFPLADLKDRFGNHFNFGATISWLSKKNLYLGINYSNFFGNQVKEDVLSNLRTIEGGIIGSDMQFASVALRERGQTFYLDIGYLFQKNKSFSKSGFLVSAGAGFLTHKIRIVDDFNSVIQLQDPYIKGYDRLSQGFSLIQKITYLFLSRDRMVNFYISTYMMEAFTKDKRQFNFNQSDLKPDRLDILAGLQVGWIIPVYLTKEPRYY